MSSQQQEKLVIAIGKRKTAIARAIIRRGVLFG
jgi:ribosomal protein S9